MEHARKGQREREGERGRETACAWRKSLLLLEYLVTEGMLGKVGNV